MDRQTPSYVLTPVFKVKRSHCFMLATGCFLWALLMLTAWHLIVFS
jgi:hypothetical protein